MPGLHYLKDYITPEEEQELVAWIDAQPWEEQIRRRVQQYGHRFNYRGSTLEDAENQQLPPWVRPLTQRFLRHGFLSRSPEQMIINEYIPGQGIGPHVDSTDIFGPEILSLSLLAPVRMELSPLKSTKAPAIAQSGLSLWVQPRSLLVFQHDARYQWRHGIPKTHEDLILGQSIPRQRRISITFRTVTQS